MHQLLIMVVILDALLFNSNVVFIYNLTIQGQDQDFESWVYISRLD